MQIKEEYLKLFNATLEKEVGDDVSGDYGKLLLSLIRNPKDRVYEDAHKEEEPHVIETVEEPLVQETPTLVDYASFNPREDSELLRKAMKGLGTDEKTLIRILANRTIKQRQEIISNFKTIIGRDLVSGMNFKQCCYLFSLIKLFFL